VPVVFVIFAEVINAFSLIVTVPAELFQIALPVFADTSPPLTVIVPAPVRLLVIA
jgi:hypothetical protein